ncbi:hypothetical protein V8C86DRAFT_3026207 [Haematococcus lacustris]
MPAVQLVGQTISGSVILGSQWMGGQGSGRKRKANAETNAGAAVQPNLTWRLAMAIPSTVALIASYTSLNWLSSANLFDVHKAQYLKLVLSAFGKVHQCLQLIAENGCEAGCEVDKECKTEYGTGQRVLIVVAKDPGAEPGDLDTSLAHLALEKNKKATKHLKPRQRNAVEDALGVMKEYLTRIQPFLKQLFGWPLNLLAIVITDPTTQRPMDKVSMIAEPAQEQCPAQAPHTDFFPVGPGHDDGLIFLLAWHDFDLIAYMGNHTLSEAAAPFFHLGARGKTHKDMPRLNAQTINTLQLQEGTLVHVKAGEFVMFLGNTVHAGYLGRPDSCSARLYWQA